MRRIEIGLLLILAFWSAATAIGAVSATDSIVFLQNENGLKTLYIAGIGDDNPRVIDSAKDITVFIQDRNLLYLKGQELYSYNATVRQARLLTKFLETEIALEVLDGAPNQALVMAKDDYNINWYILELNDGSLRRVKQPNGIGSGSNSLKSTSPDEKRLATVKANIYGRYNLTVEQKVNGKFKLQWELPNNLSLLPELPVWSPDSESLAFYAKPAGSIEGYYSLYILNSESLKLKPIQEKVFAKGLIDQLAMGGFRPDWSEDGSYLVFQFEPYGAPNQGVIIKYEVLTAKKETLVKGPGKNEYPCIAPSGDYLLFLSDREGVTKQTYLTDIEGKNLRRISPSVGETEWAKWY